MKLQRYHRLVSSVAHPTTRRFLGPLSHLEVYCYNVDHNYTHKLFLPRKDKK